MYVAVKGGEAAIRNAHPLLADRRRGNRAGPARLPRRRSASSRCALRMAASPPLTATYIG